MQNIPQSFWGDSLVFMQQKARSVYTCAHTHASAHMLIVGCSVGTNRLPVFAWPICICFNLEGLPFSLPKRK